MISCHNKRLGLLICYGKAIEYLTNFLFYLFKEHHSTAGKTEYGITELGSYSNFSGQEGTFNARSTSFRCITRKQHVATMLQHYQFKLVKTAFRLLYDIIFAIFFTRTTVFTRPLYNNIYVTVVTPGLLQKTVNKL